MTDLIAKRQPDGSYLLYDPLDDAEPVTALPNPPGDAKTVIGWLSSGLAYDVQVEE